MSHSKYTIMNTVDTKHALKCDWRVTLSHLTSTSPPTCITNEPSGCFTDSRKSNSFSLERVSTGGERRGEEEEMYTVRRRAGGGEIMEREKEIRERTEGRWKAGGTVLGNAN